MKIKFLSVLAILIISMLGCTACNVVKDKTYDATSNDYFEFVERDDGTFAISVKDGAELPEKIKLPAEYQGVAVVEISARAFKNQTVLTSVTIPVGYSIIGVEAFAFCENLEILNVGQQGGGVARDITVRASAFQGCSKLINVTLGMNVTEIDSYAFYETGVTSINARGLKRVGEKAFGNCSILKSFYVCATLTDIHDNAFKGSDNVTFSVAESNSVYTVVEGELIKR